MKGEHFNFSTPPGPNSAWSLVRLVRAAWKWAYTANPRSTPSASPPTWLLRGGQAGGLLGRRPVLPQKSPTPDWAWGHEGLLQPVAEDDRPARGEHQL